MRVALYIRSSKDQHKVSCDAQERQLKEYANSRGDEVTATYIDSGLSSTKDVRNAFNDMIDEARSPGRVFDKIYCLEMSRFGRDQYGIASSLYELREKCGVEVAFMNMPAGEAQSSNNLMEGIFAGFSAYHSQVSKEKGVEGMKQNVLNGYRAGGVAPFGYKLEYDDYGKNKRGETVRKSKLSVNEENATIITEYFERRAKNESRKSIFYDFYKRGIKTPSGRLEWSETTGKSWEDNVLQYLGHTVFNRTNEKIRKNGKVIGFKGGKKYKDQSEWVIYRNSHPALITEDVGQAIEDLKRKGKQANRFNQKRTYVLSGLLKCGDCGYNYIGDRVTYRCNAQTKAGSGCTNNGVSIKKIEDAVFSYLQQQILSSDCIEELIEKTCTKIKMGNPEIEQVSVRLESITGRIDKLLDLYQGGLIDKDTFSAKVAPLNEHKRLVDETLKQLSEAKDIVNVSEKDIHYSITHLAEEINHADPIIVKSAVHSMIDEIVVNPRKEGGERLLSVKGSFLPLTRANLVTPRGLEPLLPA